MRIGLIILAGCLSTGLAACQTTGGSERMAGLSYEAQEVVDETKADGSSGATNDKSSLDQSLDRYGRVELKDDEGKTRIICKKFTPRGTRIGKKVCLTKREWEEQRQIAKDSVDEMQRRRTSLGPG